MRTGKSILTFLLSVRVSLILGTVFAVSIAAATFIEARQGTEAARAVVYNAAWFEILLLLCMLNLAGVLACGRVRRKGKEAVFLFHFSFILILSGAGITRHFGFSGEMHIREGGTSDVVFSDENYLTAVIGRDGRAVLFEEPLSFSRAAVKQFDGFFKINGHGVRVKMADFIPGAEKYLSPDPSGVPGISLAVMTEGTRRRLVLLESESEPVGRTDFSFGRPETDPPPASFVRLDVRGGAPVFISNEEVQSTGMGSRDGRTLKAGTAAALTRGTLYTAGEIQFALEQYIPAAGVEAVRPAASGNVQVPETDTRAALVFEAATKTEKKRIFVFGSPGRPGREARFKIAGAEVRLASGPKATILPFTLRLDDFRIDRYPGSMKPSGFTSEVTLMDNEKGIQRPHSIFMNHILRYRGYRFYQSSYDEDEMGTVLSVSRDPGILPTYAGYVLLAAGLILHLFRPQSRFRTLGRILRKSAKAVFPLMALIAAIPCFSYSEGISIPDVIDGMKMDAGHCRRFGLLAVQDNGRIKPVHSLAKEWIRGNSLSPSLRECDMNELALRVFVYTEISDSALAGQRPGGVFRIFPLENDSLSRWVDADAVEKQGKMESGFARIWTNRYRTSVRNGDWMEADSLLAVLEGYQADRGNNNYPGKTRLKAEVFYNNVDAFSRLAPVFFWTGLALLACSLVRIFLPKTDWKGASISLAALLALGFLVQTSGLGLRWFVSGHAPWTNKYESMVFIAWSILLAGILSGMKNRPALAGAGILSGTFLLAARMDWMDPKITTLPPVLRSVWLVIHVSVIISSYGFLGLGAVLALINLILSVFNTKKTARFIRPLVEYETLAVERVLLIGLTLLIIGNFLGAVWANESWGRYWGWDPKETWTLVTILLYAMVLHMRLVPRLSGGVLFNAASLFAFFSVLMTYFGVNLYLSGMHSYASGGRPGFPYPVLAVAAVLVIVVAIAFWKERTPRMKTRT